MADELELKIQQGARNKDGIFRLSQLYKKPFRFIRESDGFRIYAVDGEWVRNNLAVRHEDKGFEHAGHGLVHEFIPLDEIWVDTNHFEGCPCLNVGKDRKISQKFFESTALHEIIEFRIMNLGLPYKIAHELALWVEKKIGILKDPYTEEYDKD